MGIALVFEILGWVFQGQSFLFSLNRVKIMILQVSVIGIIAVGVTQVIISGGIDLSSGSVVGAVAMVAMSFAQASSYARAIYPGLTDLPAIVLRHQQRRGKGHALRTGFAEARRRGLRGVLTMDGDGQHSPLVVIFIAVAVIFHVAMKYTRYGKFTYAIGANAQAARVSGINVERHLVKVYVIAAMLAALAGMVVAARGQTAQAGMGLAYELDAIAMAVIGGVSLNGGRGSILGTAIGMVIFGVIISGFTFLRLDAYYQEMIKGVIIVAAVVADTYRQKKRRKS